MRLSLRLAALVALRCRQAGTAAALVRLLPAVLVLLAATPAAAGAAATVGEQRSRTLVPGVVATWYPDTAIDGSPTSLQLVTVTWPLGDRRYRLRTVETGGPIAADGFFPRRRLSAWGTAQPRSLVAAISPDFGTYRPHRARPSGLEVAARVILHAPSASTVPPSVGYTRGGWLVFGNVRLVPIAFQLPNGVSATVSAMNAAPAGPAGVGAYASAGTRVAIPPGDRAVILARSPFTAAMHAPRGVTSFAGEPQVYALHASAQPTRTLVIPIRHPVAGVARVTVPAGGAVLLVRKGGAAAAGFAQLLARTTPQVQVNVTDTAWAGVTDVMGGKPMLVRDGIAVAQRPVTMSDYQWSAATSRIALGETADGQAVVAVLNGGNTSAAGVDASQFARTLVQLGVTNAIAFDAGPVPAIYSPRYRNGTCSANPGWCYRSAAREPSPALATALYTTR